MLDMKSPFVAAESKKWSLRHRFYKGFTSPRWVRGRAQRRRGRAQLGDLFVINFCPCSSVRWCWFSTGFTKLPRSERRSINPATL